MQTTFLMHDFDGRKTGLLRRSAVAGAIVLTAHLGACSSRSDSGALQEKLTQAESKITVLESELAQLKARVEQPTVPAAISESTAATATTATSAEAPAEVSPIGQQWTYNVVEEQMTGGMRKLASVSSTNTVDFGFPYAGPQNGHLTLRIDPRYGKDVIFRIERGQVLCTSYDGCTVQVRFDDEKPTRFSATAPADHSSETVFIDDYARFLTKMRKAKRVRLSLDIYQNGRPVFDFDVSGFDSDKYQAKKS